MSIETCDNGHRCENGSKCVQNPYDEGSYYCDCSASNLLDGIYAGLYCEHKATEYCTLNSVISSNAFCTNGGICVADVTPNAEHLGCDCPTGYEGEHCQFVVGTEPIGWPFNGQFSSGDQLLPPSNHDIYDVSKGSKSNPHHTGLVICLVVFSLGLFLLISGFVLNRTLKRSAYGAKHSKGSKSDVASSMTLDADGGTMKGINGSKATLSGPFSNGSDMMEEIEFTDSGGSSASDDDEGSGHII